MLLACRDWILPQRFSKGSCTKPFRSSGVYCFAIRTNRDKQSTSLLMWRCKILSSGYLLLLSHRKGWQYHDVFNICRSDRIIGYLLWWRQARPRQMDPLRAWHITEMSRSNSIFIATITMVSLCSPSYSTGSHEWQWTIIYIVWWAWQQYFTGHHQLEKTVEQMTRN